MSAPAGRGTSIIITTGSAGTGGTGSAGERRQRGHGSAETARAAAPAPAAAGTERARWRAPARPPIRCRTRAATRRSRPSAQMAMSMATAVTDTEKQQQMTGLPQSGTANYNVFQQEDNTASGIRAFFFRDGPRGVNLNANSDGKHDYSTAFPVAIARGAAFDDELEFHIGQAIGDEMLASGNTMLLAPTINILRHPAWGRAQETYGEDPFLLGRLGSAFVAGVQQYAAACAKHYAANNIENGRESANAMMDEQTLREIYARHFEMVIEDGGVACDHGRRTTRSTARTRDAEQAPAHRHLLRDDFGFQGFVLSDWWAMPNGNATRPDAQHAASATAVRGGERGPRYGAALAIQLLEQLEPNLVIAAHADRRRR